MIPCKITLSYFIMYTLFFVKIAIHLSSPNCPIKSKDSVNNAGKIYEFLYVLIK